MKITKLKLINYRCFESFEIAFSEQYEDDSGEMQQNNLHVLLAPNMVGKSAILKALRIAIGVRLQKIKANPAPQQVLSIDKEEHRITANNIFADIARNVSVEATGKATEWDGKVWASKEYQWSKSKSDYKGRSRAKIKHSKGNIMQDASDSFDRATQKKEGIIPLFLYVGTEYIHQRKPETNTLKKDGTAHQGYWYCLDDKSMENYVFVWFEKLYRSLREQQLSELARELHGDLPQVTLDTFKNALKAVLPKITAVDWVKDTLKDKKQPEEFHLVFKIEGEGIRTYNMLSDGYRYLVLLVGELVARATLLNKHLADNVLKEITGVVMIDEFGIHLHPDLQADALNRLATTFPNIQFIVTTHSPLLINGLRQEQLYLLSEAKDGSRIVEHPDFDAIGLGAEGILINMFRLPNTFDKVSLARNEEYKALLEEKRNRDLSEEETLRFQRLGEFLAQFRLDPELKIMDDDPIVKLVKKRLEEQRSQNTDKKAVTDEEINSILDDILKP